jgi:hypothetical protein
MSASPVRVATLVTALVSLAAVPAAAQRSDTPRFAVTVGAGVPLGDMGDAAKTGYVIGAQVDMPVTDRFTARISGDYARYAFSNDLADVVGDGHWTQIGVMASAIAPIQTTGVYLLGGLGFYQMDSNASGSDAESDLAYTFGAGVGRGRWFLEARYQSIQLDPEMHSMPIVLGWKF